jgi:NAD(P)H-nitrite reductase large subunit
MTSKYLIIGGSAGGIGAVEAIRKLDNDGKISLISEEPYQPYSRPMISDFLAGEATFDKMQYRPPDFWVKNKVKTILGRQVTSIDFDNRIVKIKEINGISFEKLLISTGGKPFVPPIDGSEKDGVYTFTNLSDAQLIKERIADVKDVVVIGGGLIGVSITEALVKLNKKVTLVELKDSILNLILDKTAAGFVEESMKKNGVNVLTDVSVEKILGRDSDNDKVGAVVLTDGCKITCDLLIIAIGVVPRMELVEKSKVKTNRGILVDERMATNISEVYACGDVAEAYDFIAKENRVLALWPLAYLGGRTAGYNMAGSKAEYPGGTVMSALKYFNVPIISAGLINPDNQKKTYDVITTLDHDNKVYKKLILKDDKLLGLTLVGDIEKAGIYYNIMKESINLRKYKENLVSEEFGLAHLPRYYVSELLKGS